MGPAPSRLGRMLYLTSGSMALALGALGVVLPLLPTTPFILLSAFCFARSAPRAHTWLLRSRLFGPILAEWQEHRAVPHRAKVTAIATVILAFGLTVATAVGSGPGRILLAVLGVALVVFLARLPSRDAPARQWSPREREVHGHSPEGPIE